MDAVNTAPARRFPPSRLDDVSAGFGRMLKDEQLTAWFRAWPSAAFEGRRDKTRSGVATAEGTFWGLENAVLARSKFSTPSSTPRFARQEAGAAHGLVRAAWAKQSSREAGLNALLLGAM